jgi:hypothetical protein
MYVRFKPVVAVYLLIFIISSDLYRRIYFYLKHSVVFILELKSPLSSGCSYCLMVLSSYAGAGFSHHELQEGHEALKME